MKIERVNIATLKENTSNPRVIKDAKFKQLIKSIKEFPQMLEIRPIVVNDENIVLGGNMRLKALKSAGILSVPVIKVKDLTPEQQKEFIIKDNAGFGDWDLVVLANEWDVGQLEEWGLDVPKFESEKGFNEPDLSQKWFLNIEMDNESQAQLWYDKLLAEGLNVKIVQ